MEISQKLSGTKSTPSIYIRAKMNLAEETSEELEKLGVFKKIFTRVREEIKIGRKPAAVLIDR